VSLISAWYTYSSEEGNSMVDKDTILKEALALRPDQSHFIGKGVRI
jgi:hypothetical protein